MDVLCGPCVDTQYGLFAFGHPRYIRAIRTVEPLLRGHPKWDPVHLLVPQTSVSVKQYCIPSGECEISDTIAALLQSEIIRPTLSAFNSPIWPVKKPDGSWRMTVDYRELNKVTPELTAVIPDMVTILECIIIDLANEFFSIDIHPESQEQFAFTWLTKQYTFTVLPQGFKHSPTICHQLVQADLERLDLPDQTACYHYIDDVMISGPDELTVQAALDTIVTGLQERGWAINSKKVQGPATSVVYLGVLWMGTDKCIPPKVQHTIQAFPTPSSKQQLQTFLGLLVAPSPVAEAPPLDTVPEERRESIWVTNGSATYTSTGQRQWRAVAYAPYRDEIAFAWGTGNSSQWAELQAATLAVEAGQAETFIYTDSWVVYKSLHTWVTTWEAKERKIVDLPLWGANLWQQLLAFARQQPLAVGHVDAHTKQTTWEAQLNAAMDQMAGHTITESAMGLHVESGHRGAHAARQYGVTKGENLSLVAYWAARLKCTVCTKLAPVALALATGSVCHGHLPCSEWQIDYIGLLPPSRSWLYALTSVDTYTGLQFVHPCKHADAAAMITALTQLSERYGVPLAIQSDQGTHFTAQRVRDWAADLWVTWTFHMPYIPTVSGLIERMNGLLKEQILKLTPTNTLKGWWEVVHHAVFPLNNRAVGPSMPYEYLRLAPEQGVVVHVRQASLPGQVQVEGYRVVLLAGTPESVAPQTTAEPWAGADVLECTPEILFAVNT
ncbi:uncharacterized protein LOC142010705 [Carettochelys insculpta]|uniref:uncharacterized protein LOC142010705 n=1 Tax=Carettochelys insculpta TaxID=44489 RepID=UPI003EB8A5D4